MTETLTRREMPTEARITGRMKATPVLDESGKDQGLVTAYVSVFGVKDSWGDVVVPGAFADDVAAVASGDLVLPVIWSHQRNDPDAWVGQVTEMAEDDTGLPVTMQFDMNEPKAAKAYRLVKSGRVSEWSFAYKVLEGALVETPDGYYYELRKVKLYEVGPTLMGANDQTRTLEAKSAPAPKADAEKAGRTISAATRTALDTAKEALTTAITEIDALLALTDGKAAPQDPAKSVVSGDPEQAEDPEVGKAPSFALTAEEALRAAKALSDHNNLEGEVKQ